MPGELGLVRQRIDRVVHHMQSVGHLLDHDRARAIADNPVQHRHAEPVAYRLRDDVRVGEGCLHLVNRREVGCDPHGELVGGDVRLPVNRAFGVFGESGEIQAGNAQPRVVSAIEIKRIVVEGHRHADHGVLRLRIGEEGIGERETLRSHHHALAVARAPIEVARQIHVALIVAEPDSRAHIASSRRICPFAPARIRRAFLLSHRVPASFER